MSELNVGDEVMMMEEELHAKFPENYPAKGSIGVVVQYSLRDEIALVDWGQDSGVDLNDNNEYAWWCGEKRLAKVNANTQVNAQKGVCNMSKFKVGDKVVFTNAEKHEKVSQFYPVVGTVGTVVKIDKHPIAEKGLLVDWGDAEGIDVWEDGTKSWWCNEDDVKLYACEENEHTDGEVWEMLKPKMRQFVPAHIENLDLYSPAVKNMVVAAYRSGYGRAIKGRDFMIKPKVDGKPKVDEKQLIEEQIEAVLNDKRLVTFYNINNKQSYNVSNFEKVVVADNNIEIYHSSLYDSAGWIDESSTGFDYLYRDDCEMYVAIPFSEVVGQFNSDSIKALYCGNKPVGLCHIKQWAIGEYNKMMRLGNQKCMSMTFKPEWGMQDCYASVYSPNFRALVPIRDYLKHEGVNV